MSLSPCLFLWCMPTPRFEIRGSRRLVFVVAESGDDGEETGPPEKQRAKVVCYAPVVFSGINAFWFPFKVPCSLFYPLSTYSQLTYSLFVPLSSRSVFQKKSCSSALCSIRLLRSTKFTLLRSYDVGLTFGSSRGRKKDELRRKKNWQFSSFSLLDEGCRWFDKRRRFPLWHTFRLTRRNNPVLLHSKDFFS